MTVRSGTAARREALGVPCGSAEGPAAPGNDANARPHLPKNGRADQPGRTHPSRARRERMAAGTEDGRGDPAGRPYSQLAASPFSVSRLLRFAAHVEAQLLDEIASVHL